MPQAPAASATSIRQRVSPVAVFGTFLKLGLTSFGGPIAHLGYFREEFVERKKWIEDRVYAALVALCQLTPGPASSKVGIGIGLAKAGLPGAFAAWFAFTLPSALALLLFAYGVEAFAGDLNAGWLHGLKVVAVAVVAQAVWGMAKNLTPDAPRFTLAIAAAAITMFWPTTVGQVAAIVFGALVGLAFLRAKQDEPHVPMGISLGKTAGALCLIVFFALLIALPALKVAYPG